MAQDIHQSLFSGMNQDLSKTSVPANKYYRALNFRITTDRGLSSSALENIRGNLDLIEIPETSEVKKLEIAFGSLGATEISITVGAVTGTSLYPFVTTSGSTSFDLYNHILNDPGFSSIQNLIKIYYNSNSVLIYAIDPDAVFNITQTSTVVVITDDFE